jgi:apolipoprotein N-acyltransferase
MALTRWTRLALAILSGLALAAAFPKLNLNLLAWVAFVPLFLAIEGERTWGVFGYALLQGFACNVASLYWIVITLHNFTSLRLSLAVLPMLLLAGVIALYGAAGIAVGEFAARRLNLPIVLTMPIAWTAFEWIRTYFPIGFPWNLLGYAAYRNLELIQFAEFTGVYGISALIMFFNAVVYVVLFHRYPRRTQTISLGALTAAMAAALIFGSFRISRIDNPRPSGSLRIAMVQGNIPQSLKWDPRFLESSFDVYRSQSELAARRGADLIAWPEAAAAFFFQPDDRYPPQLSQDAKYRQKLLSLAQELSDPILFGAPALGIEDNQVGFYNRAYLVSATGKVEAWYDKIQLVPFGEYVPLRSVLGFFVNRVVHGFGDMFPGRAQTLFQVKGAKLGVLICYESIFPNLARTEVKRGATILMNITNDAWYGKSSAPYQLLAMSAMRAAETKVPVVRVANTGISAVIEPTGAITARTPLFQRGTETERVYWRPELTIYSEVGDVFAIACLVIAAAMLLIAAFRPPASSATIQDEVPEVFSANGRTQYR